MSFIHTIIIRLTAMPGSHMASESTRAQRSYPWMEADREAGFSSVGVVIALSLTLVLIFSSAQVYWINSRAGDIQFAADAGALAAENVVAEYYVITRTVDAVLLSMTLFGLVVVGVGIVVACIPYCQSAASEIFDFAFNVFDTRDKIADDAVPALTHLQKALPFIAIANAAATVSANSPNDSAYIGLAILVPLEFEEVKADRDEDSKQAAGDIEADSKKASEAVEAAETAKQAMDEAHHNGWLADCGNSILSEDKGYCMYERALKLAGITYPTACPEAGWTFGMALERARSYYAYRMTNDQPLNQTTKELAKCEVRKQYYAYAYELLLSAYVFDDGLGTVRLYFPTLPNSLNDFKNCRLYTDQVYPCDNKSIIHGTTKCGEYQANGARGFGSIAQLDNGSLVKCDECQMDLSTTGHIFDMTTRTDTGFEHWYREMALAAQEYEKHAKDYKEKMDEVLGNAKQATDRYQEAFDSLKVTRLNPHPPGRKGCIVIVVDPSAHELPFNLETPLIAEQGPLPMRMAISASALAKDAESNILGDFFNNLSEKANASSPVAGAFVFGADIVFEVWGTILEFYGKGTEGLIKGIGNLIRFTSFDLSSPIAEWAEDTIKSFLEFCGLQPVDLRAPKPLLVNSLYVANADPDSILGQVIVGVKTHYGNLSGNGSGTLPDMIIDSVTTDFESYFNDAVNDGIELFRFSIGPDYFNIEVPIKVCIPEVVVEPLVEQVNSGLSKLQEYLHGEDYKDVWK